MGVPPDGNGTMDSVDIWVAPDPNQSIVFVTDKTRDCLEMPNPVTNTFIGRLGSSGSGPGELNRPNGVAVAYNVPTGSGTKDVVFTVERDNHRVSAFSLPDKTFLGSFGTSDLNKPYGIALYWKNGQLQTWITEIGPSPDKVVVFDIAPDGQGITGNMAFSFPVNGALESIVIDPVHQRALICDEGSHRAVMVYDLNGNFMQRFGDGLFVNDPEGIVLYDLGNGGGYIIVSDQNASPTEFEVFDRQTFQSLGHFSGPTRGTDGIALTQYPLPNLPDGSFYAVNSDRNVHVYNWADIASAMGLLIHVFGTTDTGETLEKNIPHNYLTLENYPNPFNPSTNIYYRVDYCAPVQLSIYNMTGQKIKTLVNSILPQGEYHIQWNGKNNRESTVTTGTYLALLTVGNRRLVKKMLLLK